jgi:hypothetical protein
MIATWAFYLSVRMGLALVVGRLGCHASLKLEIVPCRPTTSSEEEMIL